MDLTPTRLDSLGHAIAARFSRRAALRQLGALTLMTAGTASLATAAVEELHAARAGAADAATGGANEAPALREFSLSASEFEWEIMPGTTVRAWGYNRQVPGPEIRVREGDRVRVTLQNELPVPTTIHWHGMNVPPAMDGVAGLSQAAVEPGKSFVYEFVARQGGTRWYHSHADPALQVPLGLYGPLIVEPRRPARAYDRDYTYILGEWDLELTPAVAAGRAERGPGDRLLRGGELGSDLFLLNGHAHDAVSRVVLAEGDRVLLRLINAGHLPHAVHLHGHSFKIVATDGNPVPEAAQLTKDTVLVGPAERYDLEFTGDNPGVWMFHCHMEHHMANGMMTLIQYQGAVPTGPAAAYFDPNGAPQLTVPSHAHHAPAATPAAAATATAPPSASPAAGSGAVVDIPMVDDRFVPPNLTVPPGTTIRWVNQGRDWHSVAAFDGSFSSEKIGPGASFSVTFDNPGVYRYLCKHHALQGMAGTITVQ